MNNPAAARSLPKSHRPRSRVRGAKEKERAAQVKQSIKQSRGGPPAGEALEHDDEDDQVYLRLKVTEGYQGEEGFTTSRAPSHARIISSRILVTGPEMSAGSVTTSFER